MTARQLVIYSGRNRPDLAPVYRLFQQLTGVEVRVEKVYHHDVARRVIEERHQPQADLLLTNSQLAMESIRHLEVFEPNPAAVAARYPAWLRAPDFAWLGFSAWPRVAMVNRRVLTGESRWPQQLEDLLDSRFKGAFACASLVEMTTVAHFAALAVARGRPWTSTFIEALITNGLRVYQSNLDTREALVREALSVVLANSSNVHVFQLEGNAVGEAWLDQGDRDMGTHVEAHTVAVLRGCRHPAEARTFVDFLLSVEVQEMLARLYGETPVNPEARTGWARPLDQIRRLDAPLDAVVERIPDTTQMLRDAGFEITRAA